MLEPSDWLQYKAGENVTLKTTLEYSLISSEFGTMSLIIQGPNFKSIAQKDMEVSNQESSMTIEVDITVPKDKTMSVFGALTLQGQDNSISADSRNIELYNYNRGRSPYSAFRSASRTNASSSFLFIVCLSLNSQ